MNKKKPQVDDADVDRFVNWLFGKSIGDLPAEERADAAYQVALNWTKLKKRSNPYAEEIARRVRARALWIKAPTGIVVDTPD